jgi:hypothetical protein
MCSCRYFARAKNGSKDKHEIELKERKKLRRNFSNVINGTGGISNFALWLLVTLHGSHKVTCLLSIPIGGFCGSDT